VGHHRAAERRALRQRPGAHLAPLQESRLTAG
jgi:hypothetical protein